MNPVIIIPTYVGGRRRAPSYDVVTTYDHVTPISHQGELPRCLASLRDNQVDAPIILLVAAEPDVEDQAAQKIREIAEAYREDLKIQIIDAEILDRCYDIADGLGFSHLADGVSLTGYGAIRNLGLVVAAIRGFTEVVFIDDDEIVTESDFLKKAMYGLGKLSKKGIPVLVKSGFFIDRKGNWKSSQKKAWYNRFWEQSELFNEWIEPAMAGPRLSRSNSLYGGLMAIHREAFRRVSFDPWIPRGEDLDYLLNLRMYGGGVWFDNKWSIQHLPPTERNEAQRFRQDIYRWIYEHRKLEFSKTQIDLLPIAPHSLDPYPGPFLENSISTRVFLTALLRTIGRSIDRAGYLKAARASKREAKAYAEVFCSRYFEFQTSWPQVLGVLENNLQLKLLFEGGETAEASEQNLDVSVAPERADEGSVDDQQQDSAPVAIPSGAAAAQSSLLEPVLASRSTPGVELLASAIAATDQTAAPATGAPADQAAASATSEPADQAADLLDFELDFEALGLED